MHGFFLRLKTVTFSALILGAGLSLASCGGNGSLFGNGSGSASSATAANQIAGIDIANGNYSGAIAVLSPFCPNNNCQNSDLANTLANAYMAMGNSSAGASVTGATSVTGASGGGATVSQILSSVLNLVNGGVQHIHHGDHPGRLSGRSLHQQQYLHPDLSRQPGHRRADSGQHPLHRTDLRRRQLSRLLHHHRGRHALHPGGGAI